MNWAPLKGDVTQDDLQWWFLAQHSITTLLWHCFECKKSLFKHCYTVLRSKLSLQIISCINITVGGYFCIPLNKVASSPWLNLVEFHIPVLFENAHMQEALIGFFVCPGWGGGAGSESQGHNSKLHQQLPGLRVSRVSCLSFDYCTLSCSSYASWDSKNV